MGKTQHLHLKVLEIKINSKKIKKKKSFKTTFPAVNDQVPEMKSYRK